MSVAHRKWWNEESSNIHLQIRQFPQGSAQQNQLLQYYTIWNNHENSQADDEAFDKIDALNLALSQYPSGSDSEKSLLIAFYNWYMQQDDDDNEKDWRDILIHSLPSLHSNPTGYVERIVQFHGMYFAAVMSTRGGEDDDEDDDDEDSGSGDYDYTGGPASDRNSAHTESGKKS